MSEKQSAIGVLKFATIVCLLCSLLVSTAAVSLRSFQKVNADNEKKINILRAAGLVGAEEKLSTQEINEKFKQIIPLVVDLSTGKPVSDKNPLTYDMYNAARGNTEGHELSDDPAGIKRIAKDGVAYVVADGNNISRLVLPIQGYGLWSTMYGFTALSFKDKQPEITGITFYQHAETPGLGARITESGWQSLWSGVIPYDDQGNPQVDLVKVRKPGAKNQVDAIAGATLTSNGVEHLMNFWLGNQGYKSLVTHIQNGEISLADLRDASQSAIKQKTE
ncbi:MAG: Na(+)-translocating NADH-quinone reductase subunit C [Cardiobacteriaceae bacterium]|nr:Na(+)-translocating NADH-quinone reductase subunit C [Cardiobacteriaceae bacterium]